MTSLIGTLGRIFAWLQALRCLLYVTTLIGTLRRTPRLPSLPALPPSLPDVLIDGHHRLPLVTYGGL